MGSLSDERQVDVCRIATRRFAVYASFVAALMGFGLAIRGEGTTVTSWQWFALAALGGVAGSVWSVRSLLGPTHGGVESSTRDGGEDARQAPVLAPAIDVHSTSKVPVVSGDTDYLMSLRHEFRTPLNAVLGFSNVLLSGIDGEMNESQREDMEIIRASGIRLRVLLDSALDLSQLADGDLRIGAERTDLRNLVGRVAVEAGQLWSEKRSARCTLPEEPCFAEADETRLRRSMLILADVLAMDHREAGIDVGLTRTDEFLIIEIGADPSEGLSLHAIPTPAEVLQSEDPTEIRKWPVAVASEVITQHGGSLYRGDSPSRFVIRLPVAGNP